MGSPWCAREEVESRQWWECGLNLKSFKLLLKLWNYCQHLSLITFSLSLSSLYTESSIKQHLAIWIETKLSFLQFQFQKVILHFLPIVTDIFCLEPGTIHQKECNKNLPKKLATYYAKSCQINFNQIYDLSILSKKMLQRSHDRIGLHANSCFKFFY